MEAWSTGLHIDSHEPFCTFNSSGMPIDVLSTEPTLQITLKYLRLCARSIDANVLASAISPMQVATPIFFAPKQVQTE
jgi:hypothetical protein